MAGRIALLIALLLAGMACVEVGGVPQPHDVFRFPGSMALSPDGKTLYVVGTNFDLAYDAGVLQAVDLEALDAAIGAGSSPPLLVDAVPIRDAVTIDSFGGELAVVEEGGGLVLFVPHRAAGTVSMVEVAQDGGLVCRGGGTSDCRSAAVPLVLPTGEGMDDPFAAAPSGDAVYVAALSAQRLDPEVPEKGSDYFMARIPVQAPEAVSYQRLSGMRIRDLAALEGGRLVAAGSVPAGAIRAAALRTLEAESFTTGLESETFSLYGFVAATDARMVLPRDDGTLWTLVTNPAALLVTSDEGRGLRETDVVTATALSSPPSRLWALSDAVGGVELAAVTSAAGDALIFVDPERGEVVGRLDGTGCSDPRAPCPTQSRRYGARDAGTDVGLQPFDLVATPRAEGGYRLWIGAFGDATLRVVDLPDPTRPWEARVVAVVGIPEPPEGG